MDSEFLYPLSRIDPDIRKETLRSCHLGERAIKQVTSSSFQHTPYYKSWENYREWSEQMAYPLSVLEKEHDKELITKTTFTDFDISSDEMRMFVQNPFKLTVTQKRH